MNFAGKISLQVVSTSLLSEKCKVSSLKDKIDLKCLQWPSACQKNYWHGKYLMSKKKSLQVEWNELSKIPWHKKILLLGHMEREDNLVSGILSASLHDSTCTKLEGKQGGLSIMFDLAPSFTRATDSISGWDMEERTNRGMLPDLNCSFLHIVFLDEYLLY